MQHETCNTKQRRLLHASCFMLHERKGFTLLELVVVVLITALIASVSMANFRKGEKSKRVQLAGDGIISALTLAQSYTRAGKNTNNTDANCRRPQYYYIDFNSSTNLYILTALNNCNTSDIIEIFPLPDQTRFSTSGLTLDSIPATTELRIAFFPPFGIPRAKADSAVLNTFNNATIRIESSDGTYVKFVTVNGLSGRID